MHQEHSNPASACQARSDDVKDHSVSCLFIGQGNKNELIVASVVADYLPHKP
jgi:hypothetical protein